MTTTHPLICHDDFRTISYYGYRIHGRLENDFGVRMLRLLVFEAANNLWLETYRQVKDDMIGEE